MLLSTDTARPADASQSPRRQEVTRAFTRTVAEVVDIHVGGETITATAEHPFWVVGAGWTAAGELRRGSALLTKDGVVVHVDSVELRRGQFKVYNFEVSDSHTYFVSSLGLLVHNTCTIRVGDLEPLHSPTTSGARPGLAGLSDDELLNSVSNPINGDPISINPKTGKIMDGNGRAYELKSRAADPRSKITPDTRVPYVQYIPDNSAFPPM